MSRQLTIDARPTPPARDQGLLLVRIISTSPLDFATRSVYLKQLEELQSRLASYDPLSVEYFVCGQEMEGLEADFWATIELINQELPQQQQQHPSRGQDGVDLSRRFRRLDLE